MEQFRSLHKEQIRSSPVTLTSNDLLDKCAKALVAEPYGIDQVAELLMHLNLNPEKNHDAIEIFDVITNMHIINTVAKFEQDNEAVKLNPIRRPFKLREYGFRIDKNKYNEIVSHKKNGDSAITKYDELLRVNTLPVFIEARKTTKRGILDTNFSNDLIAKKFAPLQECFATNQFGYIVMASPEAINETSERQQMFKQRGGILLAFPSSLEPAKEYLKKSLAREAH